MKAAILLNAKAGSLLDAKCEERAREIVVACQAANIDATAHLCDPAQLTQAARALARDSDVDAVIAAGGDGTVSAVAAGVVGTEVALGVIPLGTLNHFAKDLGIKDMQGAIDAIAKGATRRIDVGEVNGRVFINNSSIGLYPDIVMQRDAGRHHGRRSKWVAMASRSSASIRRRA